MNNKYVLVDKVPVLEHDLLTWARWFEKANRVVACDIVDGVTVSTVFLGLDYWFGDGERPVKNHCLEQQWLMLDGEQHRYSTSQ